MIKPLPRKPHNGIKETAVIQVAQSFNNQVEADTQRLGRSNKTPTNKPINTLKAQLLPADIPNQKPCVLYISAARLFIRSSQYETSNTLKLS